MICIVATAVAVIVFFRRRSAATATPAPSKYAIIPTALTSNYSDHVKSPAAESPYAELAPNEV